MSGCPPRLEPVLRVEGLSTEFATPSGNVRAVDGVSFDIPPSAAVGLVGESGSGKSTVALSILRLLGPGADHRRAHPVPRRGLLAKSPDELEARGNRLVATVFQDPHHPDPVSNDPGSKSRRRSSRIAAARGRRRGTEPSSSWGSWRARRASRAPVPTPLRRDAPARFDRHRALVRLDLVILTGHHGPRRDRAGQILICLIACAASAKLSMPSSATTSA
jgi:hypothetical protein